MADNSVNDRYAYLIVVNTGKQRLSGTTSKVFIKLKGEKAETQSHILNRPDPLYRFLQRGSEDWFVLTSKVYLGELIGMKLWIQADGCKVSW